MVRSLAEDKNIDLVVEVDRNLPAVYQDQAKVQQILTNLLSNAIKFTPEGGRIDVFAGHDSGGKLLLTVTDTGVGIAEEDRDIIFEKFRQSGSILGEDGLSREYAGTGLGLSILKELCKLLQGEIRFESELGRGSTFTVVLPWVAADRSPRESRINVQLHDLAAPSADEFKGARAAAAGRLARTRRPDSATVSSSTSPDVHDRIAMTQDGKLRTGASVHRRCLQWQSRARAAGPSSCATWRPARRRKPRAANATRPTTAWSCWP